MPRRTFDIDRALAMRDLGYTYATIAATLGVSGESTIREAIRRHSGAPRLTARSSAARHASRTRWQNNDPLTRILGRQIQPNDIGNNTPNQPPTRFRTFGIEIEFHTAIRSDVAAAVEAVVGYHIHMLGYHGNHCVTCGATVSGYTQWKLETDSSATRGMRNAGQMPYNQGGELVSPVLSGPDGLEEVKQVMAALRSVGAKVDNRHGMHVHVGANDMHGDRLRVLLYNYKVIQDTLYKLVSPSRRHNQYCREVPLAEVDGNLFELARGAGLRYREKYRGMNLAPLSRIGTIEMRMHQGTLNGKKATEWVKLMLALFEYSAQELCFTDAAPPLDMLRNSGNITQAQHDWLTRRIATITRVAVPA